MQTLNNQNGIENSSSQQDCEFTYAGFLPRLFAYIIDIIVIGIASFFIKNIQERVSLLTVILNQM